MFIVRPKGKKIKSIIMIYYKCQLQKIRTVDGSDMILILIAQDPAPIKLLKMIFVDAKLVTIINTFSEKRGYFSS